MIKRLAALLIFGLLAGCDLDRVDPRMQAMARETIETGDYYLDALSSGMKEMMPKDDLVPLVEEGKKIMDQRLLDQSSLYEEISPELKGKTLKRTDTCLKTLMGYTIAYQGFLLELTLRASGVPIDPDAENNEWPVYRLKAIEDCDLAIKKREIDPP